MLFNTNTYGVLMSKGLLSFLIGIFLIIGTNTNLQAQDSLEVTFSVDLSVLIEVGDFVPGTDTMKIAGTFTGWQDGAIALTNVVDNIYSETLLIENTFVGDTLQYKFLFEYGGEFYWEANFETNSLNREYGVTGSEVDSDENAIPNVELGHLWNDFPLDILNVSSPVVAAPTPTDVPSNVISLFSDAYDNVAVDSWRTAWSNSLFVDDFADGNPVKKYVALDYVGIETVTNQLDITEMTHFRFDLWTPNATTFRAKLVDFGPDGVFGNDDVEHEIPWENPAQGEWITYDIPLSDFTGLTQTSNIAQLIFSGLPTGDVTAFIDNVYFYTDALTAAIPKPPHAIGDTVNYNGSFSELELGSISESSMAWFFDTVNGSGSYEIVSESQDGDGKAAQVSVTYDGTPDIWRIQAVNEPVYVAEGDLIEARFWMKASTEGMTTEAFFGLPESGGFVDKSNPSFQLSTEWEEYVFEYYTNAEDADLGMRFGFKFNYPENDGQTILVDNVQLVKKEAILTEVNFTVNTAVQQDLGNFDPSIHVVGVTGEFIGWDPGSAIILDPVDEFVYTGSIDLVNVSLGDTLGYKFILRDQATGVFEWESPDRSTGNTRDQFNNRVLEITDLTTINTPEVYFSDIEPVDQTPSNYGITSIIDARSLDVGTHIAIQGIVTRTTNNFVYVQDETAATLLFSRPFFSPLNSVGFNDAVQNGEITDGDEVQISGIIGDFNGLHQLTNIHGWEVQSSDNPLPAAQLITIQEMNENGEEYESELVKMQFIQLNEEADTLRGGFIYELTNSDENEFGWIAIPGSFNTEWAGQVPPQGLFNFEGVLKEYYIPSLESNLYSITVHDFTDIETGVGFFEADLAVDPFAGLLNESFSVPVNINEIGSEAIEAFEFTVNFDPSILAITLGDQTGFLADGFTIVSNEVEPGRLVISAANTIGISTTGSLLNLNVDLIGGGISPIDMTSILLNERPLRSFSSEINVVLRRCGDVTGDETVSALDATSVLRHTVFLTPEYPLVGLDSTAADVTGNGDISAFDASWILQYDVGLRSNLGCITLPIKKNPEVVNATWFLDSNSDDNQTVKLDFRSSEFDVYAIQMEFDLSDDVSFKGINNLPSDWNIIRNTIDNKTLVSAYGVTPLENKQIELGFNAESSKGMSTIEAELTLNESTFSNLEKITITELPQEFDLQQNYPNPFNPSTQIQYSLAESGVVNLSIYNMLGQKVAEIVNSTQEAGNYQVTWNAGALSSGVYIYRLSTKGNTFTKRMMLIK